MRTALFFLALVLLPATVGAQGTPGTITQDAIPFTDLNLRFSNRSLTPPEHLTVNTIPLQGISVAPSVIAPSPQAVIVEDDQRQRLAILSLQNQNQLTLFLLEPLPLDPNLPTLVQCANDHNCQTDRTPMTGGLGCLAVCLKDLLETVAGNPLPR